MNSSISEHIAIVAVLFIKKAYAESVWNWWYTLLLPGMIADIKKQTLGLAKINYVKIDWMERENNAMIAIVYDQVVRAVMNVIQNAVEHTKIDGIIQVNAKVQDKRISFTVEDFGSRFSQEALVHGTEQFFMDDNCT